MIRLVYGGSFDPIHIGHVAMLRAGVKYLESAYEDEDLEIRIVPAYLANFKVRHFASYVDRLQMVKTAIENDWYLGTKEVIVDAYEGAIGRRVYTHEYLDFIGATPDYPAWVLCGADIVPRLDDWCNAELVSKLGRFLVGISRGDTVSFPEMRHNFRFEIIPSLISDNILDGKRLSSTAIRRRLVIGDGAAAFLPNGVSDYIKTKCLYRGSLETA